VETCEYGAPELSKREDGTLISHINEALCKGCGACAVACCNGAIIPKHFANKQIMSMVEAALVDIEESLESGVGSQESIEPQPQAQPQATTPTQEAV
jgi:MinD superfamily P-loop ATPase